MSQGVHLFRRHLAGPAAATLVVAVLSAAAPAGADSGSNRCSLSSPGHLLISPEGVGGVMRVSATPDPAQADALAVEVVTPYDGVSTCTTGLGDRFLLSGLTDVTFGTSSFGSWFLLDLATPIDVPVISNQLNGSMLSVTAYGAVSPVAWSVVGGQPSPTLDLDDDGLGDLQVTTQLGTVMLEGTGEADTIDLLLDGTASWPFATNVDGGDGDDKMTGGAGADTFSPGGGADTLDTGSGADRVQVSWDGAADSLLDGAEEDTLQVDGPEGVRLDPNGLPDDGSFDEGDNYGDFAHFIGGSGDDTFVVEHDQDDFDGTAGTNTVDYGHLGSVTAQCVGGACTAVDDLSHLSNAANVQRALGTPADDLFQVGDADFAVRPRGGNDLVYADAARARLIAEATPDGADELRGTHDDGIWDYSARTTPVAVTMDENADDGATGEGDLIESSSVGTVIGGNASDRFYGDSATNTFLGGPGTDFLLGRGGSDVLVGGAGRDELRGASGDDVLHGNDGDDRIDGGDGDDEEYGDAGADWFDQGGSAPNGSDAMRGGSGYDTVSYFGRPGGVNLSNNGRFDDGQGEFDRVGTDIEGLIGTDHDDWITGGDLADKLYGLGGHDLIHGHGGNDLVDGGKGPDKVYGDTGNDKIYAKDGVKDYLSGGAGTDKAQRDPIDAVSTIEGTF